MMKRIADFISSNIAILVLVIALLALLLPPTFSWIKPSSVNWLLGIIMCGMGLNLRVDDFKVVFTRPADIIIGCVAQFTIMPLLAFILTKTFSLPTELAIGVVLVGCCPGGTSSNVITFLAKGDLALSVGMTSVSTILAPIMTPYLTYLIVGKTVDVDRIGMLMSIIQVIIVPIVIGLLIRKLAPKFTERISAYLPCISTLAISAIVGCVISANSERLLGSSLVIIIVVILHNVCGYALGYLIGHILKLSKPKLTAISVEVGMQNSGLATSLATVHFAMYPLATVPGAIFSVWHNFSGAMLAGLINKFSRKK